MLKKLFARQEVRFLFVGGLNTIVGYGIYAVLLYFQMNYLIANTISTILGVIHSYLWNRFFTFRSKEKASTEILKFASVYLVSYLLGSCTLFLFKSILNISPYIAGFINLFITTLISYFGHKYFSFRKNNEVDKDKPLKIEWICLFLIFGSLFLNFLFSDILITTNASIVFDDLIFKGDLYQLYAATYNTFGGILTNSYITYDFPIYIFFGLWNLPMYFVTKIIGIDWIDSVVCILYAKSFLIFLTVLCLIVMNKILKLFSLSKNDQKMYHFLFLSSSLVLMVIAMFAGYEILSILFTLIGLYFYLKEDLIKFTLFFAIAVSLKLFALFIFIPLLVLKEKNIWKILVYMIGVVSIFVLAKLTYYHAPLYYESMHSFEEAMMSKFTKSYIMGPFGIISIFITLYGLICFWCYHKKIHDKKQMDLYTMYIPLVVFGFFIIFGEVHPQWSILVMPYMIFFLVYNKDNRRMNIILESCFAITNMVIFYFIYTWVFEPTMLRYLILGKLVPQTNGIHALNIIAAKGLTQYFSIFSGLMLASFLYFLWINRPEKILNEKPEKWEHSLLILRMLVIVPFALIIVFYYIK